MTEAQMRVHHRGREGDRELLASQDRLRTHQFRPHEVGVSDQSAHMRGETLVPSHVVAQIAEQAASEVPYVGSAAGGLLGIGTKRDFSARPTAECELYGHVAVLRLDVGMVFPVPLVEATEALREHLRQRVHALTGLEVSRIDIEISWLDSATKVRGAQLR